MLNKDGFLIEEPNFIESELADDNTFNAQPFRVVAYLVIRFFKIQKNRQLIHQCHECKKYFINTEFETVKKAYNLYINQDKKIKNKTFTTLFESMKKIIKRVENKYFGKEK